MAVALLLFVLVAITAVPVAALRQRCFAAVAELVDVLSQTAAFPVIVGAEFLDVHRARGSNPLFSATREIFVSSVLVFLRSACRDKRREQKHGGPPG